MKNQKGIHRPEIASRALKRAFWGTGREMRLKAAKQRQKEWRPR